MVIFNVFSNNALCALIFNCVSPFKPLFTRLKRLLSTWLRLNIFLGLMIIGSHITYASSIPNININDSKWSKYDHHFKAYTKKFFGDKIDWRVFKAQAIIESRLQIKAKSEVGARGLMQIMPRTYKEIQKKNSFFRGKSLKNPEWNIAAGIYYNSYLFKRWDQKLTAEKRIQLMLASYNAGFSRTVKAFNRAGKPTNQWLAVKPLLPKQTSDYVHRIDGLLDKALNKSPKKKAPKTLLAQVTE
jgi:membrane-bound lytic murein transglycosylase F